jgi:signal recognition particle GTPase
MAEVAAVRDATKPRETLLVVDGLTGQDAVTRPRTSTAASASPAWC